MASTGHNDVGPPPVGPSDVSYLGCYDVINVGITDGKDCVELVLEVFSNHAITSTFSPVI